MRAPPWFIVIVLSLLASRAGADEEDTEPLADLHGRERVVDDLAPSHRSLAVLDGEPASVSVTVATRHSERRRDISGSLVLSLPIEFVAHSKAKGAPVETPAGPGSRASPRSNDPSPISIIRPRDARAAVAAAHRAAGLPGAAASLDDLASRARLSALLPQLRLRATRLIDESTSLSPTSYDPERTTSSGGASLWLEARTTWSLDRLLFANEEVRIERMHHQLRDEATVLRRRVLDQLFRWQAARVAMADPMIAPRACVELWLEAEQAAIVLDVETAGWFAKWRALRAIAPVDCEADVVVPEVDLRDMDPAPSSSDDATDRRSGKRGARARQTNAR